MSTESLLATLAAFVLAASASLGLVPVVRWASRRLGVVDRPDRDRKLHGKETALGGGTAVFLATLIAFLAVVGWHLADTLPRLAELPSRWWVLLGAATAMLVVGLIDDAFTLRGRQKLLAQILILCCVVGSGTVVETVRLFGYAVPLGIFAYPVTMLWLLGAVNALNLIDGADGMATTAGTIICIGLAFLGLQAGATPEAVLAMAMGGALLGFLAYNKPPATIFLGDAGSMLIGLVVGVLATWSSVKGATVLAAAPVAVLAIPLFDSVIAILRRGLTGRSIYATDRAHLHHLLLARFGPRGMLAVVALLCGGTTAAAVLAELVGQPWIAVLGALAVLAGLVITRSFGHAELSLLLRRLSNFAESLITPARHCNQRTHVRHVQMQGVRPWQVVWDSFVEFAEKFELAQVTMDLNISWMHEGYHGVWSSVRLPDKVDQMTLRVPLIAYDPQQDRDRVIGRLQVIARGDRANVYDTLERLAGLIAELRPQLSELLIAEQNPVDPSKQESSAQPEEANAGRESKAAAMTEVHAKGPARRQVSATTDPTAETDTGAGTGQHVGEFRLRTIQPPMTG